MMPPHRQPRVSPVSPGVLPPPRCWLPRPPRGQGAREPVLSPPHLMPRSLTATRYSVLLVAPGAAVPSGTGSRVGNVCYFYRRRRHRPNYRRRRRRRRRCQCRVANIEQKDGRPFRGDGHNVHGVAGSTLLVIAADRAAALLGMVPLPSPSQPTPTAVRRTPHTLQQCNKYRSSHSVEQQQHHHHGHPS